MTTRMKTSSSSRYYYYGGGAATKELLLASFLALSLLLAASSSVASAAAESNSTTVVGPFSASGLSAESVKRNFRLADITVDDGIVLKANIVEGVPSSGGKVPLIVMPSSWGLFDIEYVIPAFNISRRSGGYVVLSYTPRGWYASGGSIGIAGPDDVADVSKVIDWALQNSNADPERIAVAGISYGGGLSLQIISQDKRVRAIAAMSGWTDLISSLFPGNTRRPQVVLLLQALAALTGKQGPEMKTVLADYWANRNISGLKRYAAQRSAVNNVDKTNANGPAVYIANTYGDSFFPPNQLAEYFERLTVPHKRLELLPGDHAAAEAAGALGIQNVVWENMMLWFDRHLKGVDNGIDRAPGVQLHRLIGQGGPVDGYVDWKSVAAQSLKFSLSSNPWKEASSSSGSGGALSSLWSSFLSMFSGGRGFGSLLPPPPPQQPEGGSCSSWKITSGVNTVADSGIVLITNLLAGYSLPKTVKLGDVDPEFGAVWISSAEEASKRAKAIRIRGTPSISVAMTKKGDRGTVVAYLYDVKEGDSGVGSLLSTAVLSWLPDAPLPTATTSGGGGSYSIAKLSFRPISHDVLPGHRIALVVDTKDAGFFDENSSPETFELLCNSDSWMEIPINDN